MKMKNKIKVLFFNDPIGTYFGDTAEEEAIYCKEILQELIFEDKKFIFESTMGSMDIETKKLLICEYIKKYEKTIDVNSLNYESILEQLSDTYWFIKWKDVDLIKILERKALKRSY